MILTYDNRYNVLVLAPDPGATPSDYRSQHLPIRSILRRRHRGTFSKAMQRWVFTPTEDRYTDLLSDRSFECGVSSEAEAWYMREHRWQRIATRSSAVIRDVKLIGKTKPYLHQVVGYEWLRTARAGLLTDEMGLGKTKQAIDAFCSMGERVVIVSPNSVRSVWGSEYQTHGWGDRAGAWESFTCTPNHDTKSRIKLVNAWSLWEGKTPPLILNYESIIRMPDEFLAACKDSILILDEAHRIKNIKAKVTKLIHKAEPAHLWMLTGTPIANKPEDLWSLAHLVKPGILGWTWWEFSKRYLKRGYFKNVTGYNHLEEIREAFRQVSFGRKKADCLDLPEKIFETREVELNPEERRAYKQMATDLKAWIEENCVEGVPLTVTEATTFATRYMRLRQITDGFVSDSATGTQDFVKKPTKIQEVLDIWEDSGRKRMVVWCKWRPTIEQLVGVLRNADAVCMSIHGGVESYIRSDNVSGWSCHPGAILVCQMDTAGEGLNLQAADLQVFLDLPETPKQRLQCVDRLHRIGQKNTVTVVDIIAKDTVDAKILKSLGRKLELVDEITTASTKVELLEVVG